MDKLKDSTVTGQSPLTVPGTKLCGREQREHLEEEKREEIITADGDDVAAELKQAVLWPGSEGQGAGASM